MVANRHERDPEVRDICKQLAAYSVRHGEVLDTLAQRYGEQPAEQQERIRGALFRGIRIGGLGKLRALQDLALLGNQVKLARSSLLPAAGSLHDRAMELACIQALVETERQIMWLQNHDQHTDTQALTVAAEKGSEVSASLPENARAGGDAEGPLVAPGRRTTCADAGVDRLGGGSTLASAKSRTDSDLQAKNPAHRSAKFYDTVFRHLVGVSASFIAVVLLNAWQAPVVLADHHLTAVRVFAAAAAIPVTLLVCLLLKVSHPPAGATALLVALGSITTRHDASNVAIGALLIAGLGELLRRIRLQGAMPPFSLTISRVHQPVLRIGPPYISNASTTRICVRSGRTGITHET